MRSFLDRIYLTHIYVEKKSQLHDYEKNPILSRQQSLIKPNLYIIFI